MELLDFHDRTSSVPFGGVVASLILDTYPVTDLEWGEGPGMFGPAVLCEAVALTKCRLSQRQVVLPGLVRMVFAREYWEDEPNHTPSVPPRMSSSLSFT